MEKSKWKGSSRNLLLSSSSLTTGASTKTSHTHVHTKFRLQPSVLLWVFLFFGFFFCRMHVDYLSGCILRQQFWKKWTCFGIPLIQKFMIQKKVFNPKKRERHQFGMVLPLQHITTVNSYNSSTVFTTAKALPTLRAQVFGGFISGVENVVSVATRRFPVFPVSIRCKSLRSGAGSFGRRRSVLWIELYKGKL